MKGARGGVGVQGVCMEGWGGGCVKSVQAEYWYGPVEEDYMCCHTRFFQ